MSKTVWTPETGWTDDGSEVTTKFDHGKIVVTPLVPPTDKTVAERSAYVTKMIDKQIARNIAEFGADRTDWPQSSLDYLAQFGA